MSVPRFTDLFFSYFSIFFLPLFKTLKAEASEDVTLCCLKGEMFRGSGDGPRCDSVKLAPSHQTQSAVRIVAL